MAFKQRFAAETQGLSCKNGVVNEPAKDTLVNPLRNGFSIGVEELWRTHANQILRVTQRITNNREDAEDALQDSFLRAHVHLHTFDGRSSVVTWLTRIAINSALMIRRKRASAPQLLSIDGGIDLRAGVRDLCLSDQGLDPEEQYAELEEQTLVRGAIRALRPSVRRALELQVQEHSVKEMAEAMGLSVSATKSRLFHAKASLRKSLARKVSRRSGKTNQLQLSPA